MKLLKFFSNLKKSFSDNEDEEDYESKLRASIKEACDKTREATEQLWKNKLSNREKEIARAYEFKLAEKDEIVIQYIKTIDDLQTQIENAQMAYQNYVQEAITIKRIIAEVSHQMEKIFNKSGELWQGFKRIQDSIDFQTTKLEEDDEKNRNWLGMSQKSNKLLIKRNKK